MAVFSFLRSIYRFLVLFSDNTSFFLFCFLFCHRMSVVRFYMRFIIPYDNFIITKFFSVLLYRINCFHYSL